jgi:predicted AlkP superfamily pyrophosphatase or phosphodiesterase
MRIHWKVATFLSAVALTATAQQQRAVVLISIDGMRPDHVLEADRHGLKIPNLRRMLREGAHATAMRGVMPTVTYPTHTTMLTGVWPDKHGIPMNLPFDPERRNQEGWYWYAEDIHAPTLWEAAARAGYIVGSISWPTSIGAPGVQFNIPEFWRASTTEDLKLLRAISTPGLVQEFQKTVGPYTVDLDAAEAGDWMRTRYAIAMIKQKRVRFLTLHLAALDHVEHATSPFSPESLKALEEIDQMVGQLETAIRGVDARAAFCVLSDHGFARVDHELNLNVAFVKEGLMTLNPRPTKKASVLLDWKAAPWIASGSAAILLRDPKNTAVRNRVEALLRTLAADPQNGIDRILDAAQIAALGGTPDAAFWVDMKTNFAIGSALSGPMAQTVAIHGVHGYAPTHPELQASFLIVGPDIRKGVDLGVIEMRNVAPTLAKLLGIAFPSATLPALPVLQTPAAR